MKLREFCKPQPYGCHEQTQYLQQDFSDREIGRVDDDNPDLISISFLFNTFPIHPAGTPG